jgi:hypothetical protein
MKPYGHVSERRAFSFYGKGTEKVIRVKSPT